MIAKPNFIIGGTAAGGTSFLSAVLIQHPQIYLPKDMRPEPHFFYKSWEYKKGLNYYYSKWFSEVPIESIAIGERSSSYLFGRNSVAKKISSVLPDMKFIFVLRNPIERTWANYRFTVLNGIENLSFMEALEQESVRVKNQTGKWSEIQPYNYTGRGLYGVQLLEYLNNFSKEQILLIKSEYLSNQTEIELQKIYNFLDLTILDFEPCQMPDHTSVSVINLDLQMKLRNHFGDRFDKIIEATRKEEDISIFTKNKEDSEAINDLIKNMKNIKEKMPCKAHKYLQSFFSDDLKIVSKIVDFDIEDWLV